MNGILKSSKQADLRRLIVFGAAIAMLFMGAFAVEIEYQESCSGKSGGRFLGKVLHKINPVRLLYSDKQDMSDCF